MTIEDQRRGADPLDGEAHAWIAHLVSGDATHTDAEALRIWREQSPAHEAAFGSAIRLWRDFGPAGREFLLQVDAPDRATPQRISRRAVFTGAGALAACGAAYTFVRPPLGLWPSLTELAADFRTSTGEQRQITLADNVSVRMNTQTSIAIVSMDATSEIELVAGEASFALPQGHQNSLVVLAGGGRTVASGARFEVRNTGPVVCVTCLDGEIRVEYGATFAVLGSSRQVHYDGRGLSQSVDIEPAEATAWQSGILLFRLTPLSEVIAEINRYRPGKVILMNAALGASPVNGRFRIQRIEEVLHWIETAFGAKARTLPGGIVLLS
jgi:transmembrane sensor